MTPFEGLRKRLQGQSIVRFAQGSVYASGSTALVPVSAFKSGMTAEYFANDDFSGSPRLSRSEPRVYFYRDSGDPDVLKAVPNAIFSVRWTGSLSVPTGGEYHLGFGRQECDSCTGTNTIRVYLDNRLLVEHAGPAAHGNESDTAPVTLQAGMQYQVRLEYTQREAGSGVELVWRPLPVCCCRKPFRLPNPRISRSLSLV